LALFKPPSRDLYPLNIVERQWKTCTSSDCCNPLVHQSYHKATWTKAADGSPLSTHIHWTFVLIISNRLAYPPVHLFSICCSAKSNSIKHSALTQPEKTIHSAKTRCRLSNAITHTESAEHFTLGQIDKEKKRKNELLIGKKNARGKHNAIITRSASFLSVFPSWRKFCFFLHESGAGKKRVWQFRVREENNVRPNLLQICKEKDELNHHSPTERQGNWMRDEKICGKG
jgi:hypothetical protein